MPSEWSVSKSQGDVQVSEFHQKHLLFYFPFLLIDLPGVVYTLQLVGKGMMYALVPELMKLSWRLKIVGHVHLLHLYMVLKGVLTHHSTMLRIFPILSKILIAILDCPSIFIRLLILGGVSTLLNIKTEQSLLNIFGCHFNELISIIYVFNDSFVAINIV